MDKLLDSSKSNGQPKILVERSAFSQKHFDENYEATAPRSPTFRQVVNKKLTRCVCSGSCVKKFLLGLFPFINILKDYSVKDDLLSDIVSGLTVGIMHIPQGLFTFLYPILRGGAFRFAFVHLSVQLKIFNFVAKVECGSIDTL